MLKFDGVTVSIAGVRILRDVRFTVEQSATLALIGTNGAGKTSLLRTVMGFTSATGTITFDGKPLDKVPAADRAGLGIGYAPEDRRLFSAFTVEENVLMPGQVAGLSAQDLAARRDRVYEILPELQELAPRPAGSVSGGQGKMVALARALMIGTRLVMLDEPFQGLAPALARRYAQALRALRDRDPDITLIITESNPGLLKKFADSALVIERGEVRKANLDIVEAA
ncbi:MAG: ATP-binding cassette domain-containing protein [Pseudomonadota bacterium]